MLGRRVMGIYGGGNRGYLRGDGGISTSRMRQYCFYLAPSKIVSSISLMSDSRCDGGLQEDMSMTVTPGDTR